MAYYAATYYSSSPLQCSSAYYLWVYYSVTSQSVENNTSTVYVSAGIRKSYSNSATYDSGAKIWCNAGSSRWVTSSSGDYCKNWVSGGFNMTSRSVGAEQRYCWKTFTVKHNADGTASIPLYAAFQTPNISGATGIREVSRSSISLPAIPRATAPVLSASSADMGAAVTIDLTGAAVSTFTHDLTYELPDGTTGTIATGVGAETRSWTVPDCATQIPSAVSCSIVVTCATYDASGTLVGSKTATLTATVPASVVPAVSAVTVTEATSGLASKYGAFIQSKSKLTVKITAAGAKGSTVAVVSSVLEGGTYTGTSWTSAVISGSGTVNIVTTVTDSRGRSAKKTTAVTVLAYTKPSITAFTAERTDAAGTASTDGDHARISYTYSVPSLNGGNTASMTIRCKQASAADYSTTLTSGTALSASTSVLPSTTLSASYRWDIRITVTDGFGASAYATAQLPSAQVIMDFLADGSGMGIGKTSEEDGLDVNWPATFRAGITGDLTGFVLPHAIAANTDLDSLTTPGQYYCDYSPTAQTLANCPTVYAFALEVYTHIGTHQRLTAYPIAEPYVYIRNCYKGEWGEWYRVYTTQYRPAPADIGAASAWEVLWTNAGPTASFAAQTLTIAGLGDYNLFMIYYRVNTTGASRFTGTIYVPETEAVITPHVFFSLNSTTTYFRHRNVTINRGKNTVAFTTCTYQGGSTAATELVPLYILGTVI